MSHAAKNQVVEWTYTSEKTHIDPFNEVELFAVIIDPDGEELIIPSFWNGGERWTIRYSSIKSGIHEFRTVCTDQTDRGLHGRTGEIEISGFAEENSLLRHGSIRLAENGKYLEHMDSTPFLWLGDTWWMGFCKRFAWPDDFKLLTKDRVEKGFNVVQIVAGLYPDMVPFDERGANEAGFPWDDGFNLINPEYFEMIDTKISWLVSSGIVPCIVGCWGYYLDFAGMEVIKKHWSYLIARYGAYPVVWCAAGEALMPFYGSIQWPEEKNRKYRQLHSSPEEMEKYKAWAKEGWTEATRHIRNSDPYKRLITIHPSDFGHKCVNDPSLIDINMLQTGHGGWDSIKQTVDMVEEACSLNPPIPVINGEVCYEGIGGMCGPEVQRFMFWSNLLSGTAGFSYGANGIWQFNSVSKPYGPSPHGMTWGNTSWEEAMKLPGSEHLGHGKRLLERYRWWLFKPHPEWIEPHSCRENRNLAYAAGIEQEVRIFYLPLTFVFGQKAVFKNIEIGVKYRAYFFDPTSGQEYALCDVEADENGNWELPVRFPPVYLDMVLVFESKMR